MCLDKQSDVILDNRTLQKFRFQSEEMNSFLLESVKHVAVKNNDTSEIAHGFIDFVVKSGYEYKPADHVVMAGKPLLRVTPILYLARKYYQTGYPLTANIETMLIKLFKIYNNFNVNYTDEAGLTHFHAACMARCEHVIERFLELGQDPNVRVSDSGDSPLIMFLAKRSFAESLLRRGADPNHANAKGLTPLHFLSALEDDDDWPNALFELSHDKYRPLKVNARNKSGDVPLLYSLKRGRKKLTEILLRRGADPNSANKHGMTPLHCICTYSEDVDLLRMYYDINEELYQTVYTDAKDKLGRTPLYLAAYRGMRQMVKFLLMTGADPSVACKRAKTPLHVVCDKHHDDSSLANILLELSQQRFRPLQVNPLDNSGNTPLHLAMSRNNKNLVKVLLRHGARPNVINKAGRTPLHQLLDRRDCDDELLELFFEINEANKQPVRIDVRDSNGNTPLHLAMKHANRYAIDLLMRMSDAANSAQKKEATTVSSRIRKSTEDDDDQNNLAPARKLRKLDPNLADANGTTILHVYSKNDCSQQLVELLPKQLLDINAQDELGNTPLHWALFGNYNKLLIELLLRSGADRNAANAQGQRPLHFICKRKDHHYDPSDIHDMMEVFFEIDGEVEVDARDDRGLTPLQLAVANFRPDMVDILLDHGADLSRFVFPNASNIAERFKNCKYEFGLELASGALSCLERLEKRGYETKRSDALTIMGLFKEYKLFAKSGDLDERFKKKKFEFAAKKLRVNSNMSLDELIQAQPGESEKLVTYTELFKFWRGAKSSYNVITARVCENMSRHFFSRWAMNSLLKEMPMQISKSLPEEICVFILEPLKNKELYNVCLHFVQSQNKNISKN
ncbi:hypothetical protein TKK_0012075 [Trichogramma kaykai]